MFTAEFAIDTIQSGKKTLVNSFVTNEVAKNTMIKFIDAQTEYTKQFVKTTTDLTTTLVSETAKMAADTTKFDFNKVFENMSKAWQVKK
jgi:hypothetical protein